MRTCAFAALGIVGLLLAVGFAGCIFGEKEPQPQEYPDNVWIDLNQNGEKDIYEDPNVPFEARAKDVVSKMTLAEKATMLGGQRTVDPRDLSNPTVVAMSAVICTRCYGVARLGIPEFDWWGECVHGVANDGTATVFPSAIGMAATWNPETLYDVAVVCADEGRAKNNERIQNGQVGRHLIMWSPVVEMNRDPRWGRTEECYGEDPFLTGVLGASFVQGLQGNDSRYVKVISSPKHLTLNSCEYNRHNGSSDSDIPLILNYYLPGYRACLQEGNARSTMAAYNSINGIPCAANKWLLTDVLRGMWGFDGYVVSDYDGIKDINEGQPSGHAYSASETESVAMAIKAGCDLCDGESYPKQIQTAIDSEMLNESDVDIALVRVMTELFRLGMFDPAEIVQYSGISPSEIDAADHRALALDVAKESMVLLKNEGSILPLEGIKSIALIGQNANTAAFGGYSGSNSNAVSPLQGIVKKASEKGISVTYSNTTLEKLPGGLEGSLYLGSGMVGIGTLLGDSFLHPPALPDEVADVVFAEAVMNAKNADVAVVIVTNSAGEEHDNLNPSLQYYQDDLVKAVLRANPSTAVVINTGIFVTMEAWIDKAPCVLDMWYGGEEGGTALADVLFGDYNPCGKLPMTFYRSASDMQSIYDYNIRNGTTYLYFQGEPQFAFGHGLSYTTFEYSNFKITDAKLEGGGKVSASVDVTNTGSRYGGEIVQLYVHDVERSSGDAPIKELKGFDKVFLSPGETQTVTFEIEPKDIAFYNLDIEFVVEEGAFDLMIGSSSADIKFTGHFEAADGIVLE